MRKMLLACAVGWMACGASPPSHETVVDLVALLSFTEEAPPTVEIRPGDPAHHVALLRGWSAPVALPDGRAGARIGNDRQAAVVFNVGPKPQPLTITIERVRDRPQRMAAPRKRTGAPRQRRSRLVLHVNGRLVRRSVSSLDTPDGVYEVPVTALQAGRNLMTIGEPGTPRQMRADRPPVSRWVYTRIGMMVHGVVPPTAHAAGDRLVIPDGAEVSYFLLAPEDARLRFVAGDGTAGTRLEASLRVDGRRRRALLHRTLSPGAEVVQPLDVPPGAPVRLTLAGPIELRHPVIEGRPGGRTDPPATPALEARPNVILYLADTLRADRLGCYGATPSPTPAIDRFAATSVLFENAVAQAPWTRPSAATILTGQYPVTHGAITLRTPVRSDLPTLASMLRGGGWTTQAFVTNLNVSPEFGFGHGFDGYDYLPEDPARPGIYEPASVLHAKALDWIAAHRDQPFFLYLHASDPHAPYRPVDPAHQPSGLSDDHRVQLNRALNLAPDGIGDDGVRALTALYGGEITEFDAEFGRLVERLEAVGVLRNTLLVFVADHGEEFREHGALQHGRTLYGEVLRIPLLVHLPGGRQGGRRVHGLARQVDLVPTVRALVGLPADASLPGTPLPMGTDPHGGSDEAITETWFKDAALTALVLPPWKVVVPRTMLSARPEVYDLTNDPGERRNVAREHPVLIGYARRRLAEIEVARGAPAPPDGAQPPVAPGTLDRLRALGYVVD